MEIFGKRSRPPDKVRFVYLTAKPAQAPEIQRLAGNGCQMTASAATLHGALEEAARTNALVLLTDDEVPGAHCREIVDACVNAEHRLAVVVILDSFDGLKWVEIIRIHAYDIVLRSLLRESLGRVLWSAHQYAVSWVHESPPQ